MDIRLSLNKENEIFKFYKKYKFLIKIFSFLYVISLILPYFLHYSFLPEEISVESFKLLIIFILFFFISYFLFAGVIISLILLVDKFQKNKTLGIVSILFSLIPGLLFLKIGELIFFIFIVYILGIFIGLIILSPVEEKVCSSSSKFVKEILNLLKLAKLKCENKGKNNRNITVIKILNILESAVILFISSLLFIFEVGILSKFDNSLKVLFFCIILVSFLIIILQYIKIKRYITSLIIILLFPIVMIVLFPQNHIYLIETTLKKFNLASDNAKFYVNEKMYALLKEENKNSLSLCNNYIETKKGKFYLVENLKIVWNGKEKIFVLTEKYSRNYVIPIPKKYLINEDIIFSLKLNKTEK
ncbi:hypothetical protein [Persephonella sp.]